MATRVRRDGRNREVGHDERRFWLYFTDGTIVDPRRCPRNVHARNHWHRVDDAPKGEPNAVCACTDPPATEET